ncbi:MAG: YhdH/YhfP family quinone oxidoreductase, partial [Deltaproteobacteria bacterium]|nr:YhdH/YhfP family quinone oxidoreductase [Deltaproteobacteria bacterium]
GEVLIRNRYAGVNYKDCLSILGRAKIIESYPRIAGIEAVGDVVDSTDARFAPGQTVLVHGFRTGIAFDGGFAQFLRAPSAHVMSLPAGLDPWQAAVLGVPGFTAGMALDRFVQAGLTPDSGPVAISGASGAVGMLATATLSRAGWQVVALTRKPEQAYALRALGASEIIDADIVNAPARALEKARFAAGIDNVGGATLSWLLRSVQDSGCVASVGNAAGNSFDGNVLPFIMRGIQHFGVLANAPWPVRERVWRHLGTDWRPSFEVLAPHVREIELEALLAHAAAQLDGLTVGRTLVTFQGRQRLPNQPDR